MSQGALQALGAFSGGLAPGILQAGEGIGRIREREEFRKLREKELEDARAEREHTRKLGEIARKEDRAFQEMQFGLLRSDQEKRAAEAEIARLQEMDLKRNQASTSSLMAGRGLDLQREQLDLAKGEASAARVRQARQDIESGIERDVKLTFEKEKLGLMKEEQRGRELDRVLAPLDRMVQTILQGRIAADAATRESANRLAGIRATLAPEAVAQIAKSWAEKGVDPATAKESLKSIYRLINGVAMIGSDTARTGDHLALAKVEQQVSSAMQQIVDKVAGGGSLAEAKQMADSTLRAASSMVGGGMVQTPSTSMPLPTDIDASIEAAFGGGADTLVSKAPKAQKPATEEAAKEAERFGVPRQAYETALARSQATGASVVDALNGGKEKKGWYSEYLGVPFKLPFSKEMGTGISASTARDLIDAAASDPSEYSTWVRQAIEDNVIGATEDPRDKGVAVKVLRHAYARMTKKGRGFAASLGATR